jgi:hypothetical protein
VAKLLSDENLAEMFRRRYLDVHEGNEPDEDRARFIIGKIEGASAVKDRPPPGVDARSSVQTITFRHKSKKAASTRKRLSTTIFRLGHLDPLRLLMFHG